MDFEELLEKVGDETKSEAIAAGREIRELLVDSIGYYDDNRELTDEDCLTLLEELKEDNFDLTHPIVVYPDERVDRDFTLIAGERRLRAFQLGEQENIVAIIRRDLTAKQIREKNIKENTQRLDESLPSLSRRYKKYCEDFGVKQKDAAKIFNVKESLFSDMVKYLWQVDQIPATKGLMEEGVSDKWMLKELVRAHLKNEAAVRSIIAFGKANNCFTRDFVLAAVKMNLHGDIETEMRDWLAGGQSDKVVDKKKSPKTASQSSEEQLDLDGVEQEPGSDKDPETEQEPGSDVDPETEQEPGSNVDPETEQERGENGSFSNGMKKRPVSKAEVLVEFEQQQFYLELGMVAEDEDKIVLRNLSGDVVLANPSEVKICYVS